MGLTTKFVTRHNLELDDLTFFDKGVSAFRGKNYTIGALSEFLRLVHEGRIKAGSYLVIEKLDRLSRDDVAKVLPVFSAIIEAGIFIATTEPERIYNKDSLKGFQILEPIMHFILANDESDKKSSRARDSWQDKRNNAATTKLSPICPAWLKLDKKTQTFDVLPEAITAIRLIFKLAVDGHGYQAIYTYLENEGIKPYGKSWCKSYIHKLMQDRRLLGELAPRSVGKTGKKKPTGEIIEGYYPQVIKPETFYAVQQLIAHRKPHKGRTGKNGPANLFTGLLYDARDKTIMRITGQGMLVSNAALLNRPDSIFASFKYEFLELPILKTLTEVIPLMIGEVPDGHKDQVEEIRQELGRKQAYLNKLKDNIRKSGDVDTLADLIREAEADIKHLKKEELKELGEASINTTQAIGTIKDLMRQADA
jgi:DNA invertase Pin-like site-specific DNA recombinase